MDSLHSSDRSPRVSKRQSSNDAEIEAGHKSPRQPMSGKHRQSADDTDIELSFNRVSLDLMQVTLMVMVVHVVTGNSGRTHA